MTKRILCLYFPRWKTEIERLLQHATPQQTVEPQDSGPIDWPRAYFLAIGKLSLWAMKFTPLVAIDEELFQGFALNKLETISPLHYGLILDVTGTQTFYGGEEALIDKLLKRFAAKDITVHIAISGTLGSAWALSRFHPATLTLVDNDKPSIMEAIKPLPIEALRLSEKATSALRQLGLGTIETLLKLPTASTALRFGQEISTRIDQALGQKEEALRFARAKHIIKAVKTFDFPLMSHESLQVVILELFEILISKLSASSLVARAFLLELSCQKESEPKNITTLSKEFALYQASAKENHILSVVQPFIESLQRIDGVIGLSLTAKLTEQEHQAQTNIETLGLTESTPPPDELINHLVIRMGRDLVTKVYFTQSYIPEKSFTYRSVMESPSPHGTPLTIERPSFLFKPPELVSAIALLPDHAPAWINWKGERLQILKSFGPERISPEWWLSSPSNTSADLQNRDYFKLQDDKGRWLWVYRTGPEIKWFLHGIWG